MRITVIYNEPESSYYTVTGEQEAVAGVLIEVEAVKNSLLKLGHQVTCVSLAKPLQAVRETLGELDSDLIFNLFEGFPGFPDSEALLPQILEESRKRYTGCPSKALKIALDKAGTKNVLKTHGIATPDFQLLNIGNVSSFNLEYPCIVKPNSEDASHGLTIDSVVHDLKSLTEQVSRIQDSYDADEALVEEYIDGREFNATVMGNGTGKILEISEIEFSLPSGKPKIITYAGKWNPGSDYYYGTKPICPACITEEERKDITEAAVRAYEITGCRGYARVDMRMDKKGTINILEINPNPDISPDSGVALQAKTSGMEYTALIEKIVFLATEEMYR